MPPPLESAMLLTSAGRCQRCAVWSACLLIGAPQPLDRDVGVDLCGGQAGVAEHLLDSPKIGAALEQMSGCAVPQTVRPNIRGIRHVPQELVNRGADLTRIDPAASSAQEQCWSTTPGNHLATTELQPSLQRGSRRHPERDRPLLCSLAHDTDQVRSEVDIVDVQAHQLTDPDPTGIQQLQHRTISQMPVS